MFQLFVKGVDGKTTVYDVQKVCLIKCVLMSTFVVHASRFCRNVDTKSCKIKQQNYYALKICIHKRVRRFIQLLARFNKIKVSELKIYYALLVNFVCEKWMQDN